MIGFTIFRHKDVFPINNLPEGCEGNQWNVV